MTAWVSKFTVYGLRLKGDKEVRYIGQTIGGPATRLRHHRMAAKRRFALSAELAAWLNEHGDNIEGFAIAHVDTREEALAHERAIIALCLRLEHRLLNRRQLPKSAGVLARQKVAA